MKVKKSAKNSAWSDIMKSSKSFFLFFWPPPLIGTAAYSTTVAAMDGKMGMGGCGTWAALDMDPMMKHMGK